jgi:hypothetical protein
MTLTRRSWPKQGKKLRHSPTRRLVVLNFPLKVNQKPALGDKPGKKGGPQAACWFPQKFVLEVVCFPSVCGRRRGQIF